MTVLFAALIALLTAAPASEGRLLAGYGDQLPNTFSDPAFTALKVKRTRYVTPWNSVLVSPDTLDRWIKAAGRREIMIAFEHASDQNCIRVKKCKIPSVAAYGKAMRAFHRKYPKIKLIQPWNELNNPNQPLAYVNRKGPKFAAQYYLAWRKLCKQCTVLGADVQDRQRGPTGAIAWTKKFLKYIPKSKYPKVWGFHNYSSANRNNKKVTQDFLKLVKGDVWFTETAGIYAFTQADGQVNLKPSSSRQTKALKLLLTIQKQNQKRVKRIYLYQWKSAPGVFFDSAVINADGTKRPAYSVVKSRYGPFFR